MGAKRVPTYILPRTVSGDDAAESVPEAVFHSLKMSSGALESVGGSSRRLIPRPQKGRFLCMKESGERAEKTDPS